MNTLRAAWLVFGKDLRIELRTGEVLSTTGLFSVLVTVLASISLYVDRQGALQVAPGLLWVALAFAGVLGTSRSWARERELDSMRALVLAPIPRPAILLGKTLGTLAFLAVVEAILLVLVGVFFQLDVLSCLPHLALLLLLGTVGFAATANLFAAMGVRTSARDLVLAIAVFPIVAPALLCGVVATRELLMGAPVGEILAWVRILIAYDIGAVTLSVVLFEPLISD